jgi:hypothetical protein
MSDPRWLLRGVLGVVGIIGAMLLVAAFRAAL